ncbi:hypothetical protein AGMMS50222_10240 [Endomicrobiia bacterium]|nr:hypothetical protein AGMMS50222_10240 [Endomicrobiia bacterium]
MYNLGSINNLESFDLSTLEQNNVVESFKYIDPMCNLLRNFCDTTRTLDLLPLNCFPLIVKLLSRKQAVRKPLKVVQLGYGNA